MSTYGRQVLGTVGRGISVSADGVPLVKAGGITIDWATVAAAGAPATFNGDVSIDTGEKFLRYGQVVCRITATGKYGPYDPAAADGRQTLTPGSAFIIERTMKEADAHSDHPVAMYGGLVFRDRILQSGVVAHSLALGPTLVEIQTTFPHLEHQTETPH